MPVAGLVDDMGYAFANFRQLSFEDSNGTCWGRKCSRAFFEERIRQVVILGITGNKIRVQIG
jgi:hypothetical protein